MTYARWTMEKAISLWKITGNNLIEPLRMLEDGLVDAYIQPMLL